MLKNFYKISLTLMIMMMILVLTGCETPMKKATKKMAEGVIEQAILVENLENDATNKFIEKQNNIKEYKIQGESRFEPLYYQRIDDGSKYGVLMIVYKDLQNSNQYLYVESGNGIAFTPID